MAKFLSAIFCLLVVGATCKTAEPTVNVVRIPPTPTHRPAKPAVKVDRKVLVKKLNGINGDILKIVDKKLLSGFNISHEEKHRILTDLNKQLLTKEVDVLTAPASNSPKNYSDSDPAPEEVDINSVPYTQFAEIIVPLAVTLLEPILVRIIDRIFDPDFYEQIYLFFKNLFKKSTREEGWTFWKGIKRIFRGRSAEEKATQTQARVRETIDDINKLAETDDSEDRSEGTQTPREDTLESPSGDPAEKTDEHLNKPKAQPVLEPEESPVKEDSASTDPPKNPHTEPLGTPEPKPSAEPQTNPDKESPAKEESSKKDPAADHKAKPEVDNLDNPEAAPLSKPASEDPLKDHHIAKPASTEPHEKHHIAPDNKEDPPKNSHPEPLSPAGKADLDNPEAAPLSKPDTEDPEKHHTSPLTTPEDDPLAEPKTTPLSNDRPVKPKSEIDSAPGSEDHSDKPHSAPRTSPRRRSPPKKSDSSPRTEPAKRNPKKRHTPKPASRDPPEKQKSAPSAEPEQDSAEKPIDRKNLPVDDSLEHLTLDQLNIIAEGVRHSPRPNAMKEWVDTIFPGEPNPTPEEIKAQRARALKIEHERALQLPRKIAASNALYEDVIVDRERGKPRKHYFGLYNGEVLRLPSGFFLPASLLAPLIAIALLFI